MRTGWASTTSPTWIYARYAAGWPSSRRSAWHGRPWLGGRPLPGCSRPGCSEPERATSDAGALLGTPKARRTLPPALRQPEARLLLAAAASHSGALAPTGIRDVAILELLYATGIRVGELAGLDIDDLDRERNVVTVLGKGRKERSVPFGRPAARALDSWLGRGTASPRHRRQRRRAVPRRARRSDRPARREAHGAPAVARRAGRSGPRSARPPAHRGRICSKVAPICAASRSFSARLAGDHADLHARHDRAAANGVSAGPSSGLSRGPGGSRERGGWSGSTSSPTGVIQLVLWSSRKGIGGAMIEVQGMVINPSPGGNCRHPTPVRVNTPGSGARPPPSRGAGGPNRHRPASADRGTGHRATTPSADTRQGSSDCRRPPSGRAAPRLRHVHRRPRRLAPADRSCAPPRGQRRPHRARHQSGERDPPGSG